MENKTIDLLRVDGFTHFLIKIVNSDTTYNMDFEVYEVTSWENDEKNTPCDSELHLTGTIKWDGCSHLFFGEQVREIEQTRYLHLCGKHDWQKHADMLLAVYALAEKMIKKYMYI